MVKQAVISFLPSLDLSFPDSSYTKLSGLLEQKIMDLKTQKCLSEFTPEVHYLMDKLMADFIMTYLWEPWHFSGGWDFLMTIPIT